jgi:FAD:protein FMN transferase
MSILDSLRGMDRREFIALGGGAFVVAGLPLAARRRRAGGALVRRTLPVMGTVAELVVQHGDERAAHAAIDAAMAELQWVERTMTRFSDASDVGRANLGAARGPVAVSGATASVVAEALRWAEGTGGAYDPAVGRSVRLWDVTHRHEPPPPAALRPLAGRHLHRAVEVGVHRGGPVLLYHEADVSVDLGAIAKGYAVDRAVAALRDRGIRHAVVDVGGDLYALGTNAAGDPWRIGVQDPGDARGVIATLEIADAAVATSGTYAQYFRWRGRRYHHLMDPETAAPRATAVQSLTIRADTCMHADVAATATYGMPPAAAVAALGRLSPGARVVNVA